MLLNSLRITCDYLAGNVLTSKKNVISYPAKSHNMLINFAFSNFRSFREKNEFSMIAGKALTDRDTLQKAPGFRSLHILPISAIFGGNASGKSNFVKAIYHFQQMVLSGQVSTEPYRLDAESHGLPSSYVLCALADERVWEYALTVNGNEVEEESLVYVREKKEVQVFHRTRDSFSIDESLDIPEGSRKLLKKMGEALAPTSIFLHSVQTYRIEGAAAVLSPIYQWLRNTLCVVSADSRRAALGVDLIRSLTTYSQALCNADTGIDELRLVEVNLDQLKISQEELDNFKKGPGKLMFNDEDSTLVLIKTDDGMHAYRCVSLHHDKNGNEVSFLFTDESDGTRRLLHLLPTVLDYVVRPRVYIVDELDRSLHTRLSRHLVEQQLDIARREPKHRQQLIFTTHDVMLMDQGLLRKDEMWAIERLPEKGSQLISFVDFIDIRKDKDIRRSYLTGRMGGLPNIVH